MKKQLKRKDIPAIRREEILNAAAELFSESGYHGVSVDAIARKAGISKGNLYWYFKSKQDIFHQLFEYFSEPLFGPLFEILESDKPPKEILRTLARACIETAAANPEIVRFGWQIASQPELKEMFSLEYTEWMEPFIERLTPLFESAGESHPGEIAAFFALTLDAFMGLAAMMPEHFEKESFLSIIGERFIDCLDPAE